MYYDENSRQMYVFSCQINKLSEMHLRFCIIFHGKLPKVKCFSLKTADSQLFSVKTPIVNYFSMKTPNIKLFFMDNSR